MAGEGVLAGGRSVEEGQRTASTRPSPSVIASPSSPFPRLERDLRVEERGKGEAEIWLT